MWKKITSVETYMEWEKEKKKKMITKLIKISISSSSRNQKSISNKLIKANSYWMESDYDELLCLKKRECVRKKKNLWVWKPCLKYSCSHSSGVLLGYTNWTWKSNN